MQLHAHFCSDATSASPQSTTTLAWHDLSGIVFPVHPSGATDSFGTDGLGNWTTYTNAEGHVYTMTYDLPAPQSLSTRQAGAQGRPLAATNALGQQVFRNFYDPAGNLTNRLDGAGNTITYSYDVLNRLTSRQGGAGVPPASLSYDAVGNLLTASNAVARETFAYDVMNRVSSATTTVNSHTFASQWKRDLGGLVTNLVYAPDKTVSRTYDPDGRLVSVSDWLGHTWTFAHDGAGKPTGGTAPGGIISTNQYDAAGRLASWSVGSLAGRTITRDAAGLKTRDDITTGPLPAPHNVRYADNVFNAADRLVAASVRYGSHTNAPVQETYLYDGNGALTNLVSASNAVFAAAYDPLGQLSSLRSSVLAANYLYDALGNRIVSGDRLFIPDHADPLKRPLMECDLSGNVLRYYIWGNGRLLGFINTSDEALTVAHCDEYGSVVALTDASGTALHTACYGPNGQDWSTTGVNPTPFAWLGGHGVHRMAISDYIGPLYLTRYRLYSASLNRFLSPDPLGLVGGLNLYAYAEGDPLTYIDPLGLGAEEKGSYLGRSFGQLFKGNYSDDVTVLGTGMQVLTGVFNFDLPGDVRDNLYNLTHWNQVSTAQKIIDAVGFLPLIGAIKYADEAGDVIKGGRKAADAARNAKRLSVDDALEKASEFMTAGKPTKIVDSRSGVQFI